MLPRQGGWSFGRSELEGGSYKASINAQLSLEKVVCLELAKVLKPRLPVLVDSCWEEVRTISHEMAAHSSLSICTWTHDLLGFCESKVGGGYSDQTFGMCTVTVADCKYWCTIIICQMTWRVYYEPIGTLHLDFNGFQWTQLWAGLWPVCFTIIN